MRAPFAMAVIWRLTQLLFALDRKRRERDILFASPVSCLRPSAGQWFCWAGNGREQKVVTSFRGREVSVFG